jgi:hypothetical protein
MESTGVYWIPLFQILEERGFKVYLVNAHSLKTVPGRKSDVSDCEWIQYLHSVGLLKASFRPAEDICAVRTLWRHRVLCASSSAIGDCGYAPQFGDDLGAGTRYFNSTHVIPLDVSQSHTSMPSRSMARIS